jgi:hypothetical protein
MLTSKQLFMISSPPSTLKCYLLGLSRDPSNENEIQMTPTVFVVISFYVFHSQYECFFKKERFLNFNISKIQNIINLDILNLKISKI